MAGVTKRLIVLALSTILVHMVYIGHIRPEANILIEQAQQSGQATPRNMVIIFKDYEQEICLILMLWGCYLIFDSYRRIARNHYLFDVDLIQSEAGTVIDAEKIIEKLDKELPEECKYVPLVQTLRTALWRLAGTGNIQNLSDAVESSLQALAIKQDADNSLIRYLIWAIPSIGFIGTVRGIGQALAKADQALAGDISGMTDSLGVAFNSTLVALLISIFLMFLFHQLQRLQDNEILDTQNYCNKYLLSRNK